jgi:hypothetical protein
VADARAAGRLRLRLSDGEVGATVTGGGHQPRLF